MNKPANGINAGRDSNCGMNSSRGYSVIEILVVLVIIAILSAISIPYFYSHTRLYKSEDQAIKIMDLMREAAQLALNRRRTIRFEINLNDNTVKLTDENGADPDVLIKSIPLEPFKEIRMDLPPNGLGLPQPNYQWVNFGSTGIWSVGFRSDGSVVTTGTTTPASATLVLWPPRSVPYDPSDMVPRQLTEVRAITLFGGSGAVRYWKHTGVTFVPFQ